MFGERTVRVYHAYSGEIADRALEAQRFVPPFKLDRMTWIKPSFLWMMYRSGWATKVGQERVLAVEIAREGFGWLLYNSCLSGYDSKVYESREAWATKKAHSPVRVQWDPERSIHLAPLPYRTIQIGLSGEAVLR